jgi:hypothetical protein
MNLFGFITHAKSSKIVLLGEPDISSPLAFAEGLFYFFVEKEGLLEFIIVYNINIKIQNKCTID